MFPYKLKLSTIPSGIYRKPLISITGAMTPSWYFLSSCLEAVRMGVISEGSTEARTAQFQANYRLDGDKDKRSSSNPSDRVWETTTSRLTAFIDPLFVWNKDFRQQKSKQKWVKSKRLHEPE